jgi:hypothetical protein
MVSGGDVEGWYLEPGVWWSQTRVPLNISCSRTWQNRQHTDERYPCLDRRLISDCWVAYRDIQSQGYTHSTVNRSISFVNPDTGGHTNTIDCTWRHVKAFLRPYHRLEDYEFHLAHYMFAARCKAQEVSVQSIPCDRRICRLVLLYHPRHVNYSCLSPEHNGIAQLTYAPSHPSQRYLHPVSG